MPHAQKPAEPAVRSAHVQLRKPRIIMIGALAFSFALAGLLAFTAASFSQATDRARSEYTTANEVAAEIVYRDEVLTMSALMAASTGEISWLDRYYANEALLDDALERGHEISATGLFAPAVLERLDGANRELVSIESEALALVREGNSPEAYELLRTDRYFDAKDRYSVEVSRFTTEIGDSIEAAKDADRRLAAVVLGLSILAGLGTMVLSAGAWRSLSNWRRQRVTALVESHRAEQAQRSTLSDLRIQLEHLADNSNLDWWQIDQNGDFLQAHGVDIAELSSRIDLRESSDGVTNVFELMKDYPDIIAGLKRALNGEVVNERFLVGESAIQSVYMPDIRDGEVRTVMGISSDISAEWRLQQELQHQAQHDSLTGLLNRSGFEHEVDSRLANLDATGSMMLFGISGLRAVNGLRGHEVGDRVLAIVAKRVRGLVGEFGLCARIGGAEFCVFVPDLDASQTTIFASELAACISQPITDPTGPVELKATVGYDGPQLHGRSFRKELPALDVALSQARNTPNATARFEPTMMIDFAEEMAHRSELAEAIERRQLHVAFQPIWDTNTGRIYSAEALARWTHPTRGPVSPGEFIPRAEQAGLIRQLDRLILEQACEQLASWQRSDPALADMRVSINLSAEDLSDDTLCGRIEALCHVNGLAPQDLLFELTESTALENLQVAQARLEELQQLGCELALDDFGTGYSSLSQLQNLAVDVLKVDRAFVSGESANQRELCEMIVGLAKLLGLKVVAEGVETNDQLDTIRQLGCDYVQGFLLAKPMAAAEFANLVIGLGDQNNGSFRQLERQRA